MPVKAGDPLSISAAMWNRLERLVPVPGGNKRIDVDLESLNWRNIIPVRNSTGGNRDRGDVAAYAEPVFVVADKDDSRPFLNPILEAISPVWPRDKEQFLVFIEPVRSGEIGRAVIDGIAWAKISLGGVGSLTGAFARIQTDEFELLRNPCYGVVIMGDPSPPTADGSGFGLVHLGRGEVGYKTIEIDVQLSSTLKSSDVTGTGEYIRPRSPFPFILAPEGITFNDADPPVGTVTFENPYKHDAMCNAIVTLKRRLVEGCVGDESHEWVVVETDKKKARWIKFNFDPGTPEAAVIVDAFWEGENPTPCESVDVQWPLGQPCKESAVIAFYDPNTDKYQAVDTPASTLGVAESIDVMQSLAFDGCTINYIKSPAKVFCTGDPGLINTEPLLVSTSVLSNVILRPSVAECANVCRYEWNGSTWMLTEKCASGSGCTCASRELEPPVGEDPLFQEFPCDRDDGLTPGPGGLDFYSKFINVCSFSDVSGVYTIPIIPCP